ncbi:MAG: T9SS type A sorting domain-containing protein [Paludibacteraceae bacterium]|nr:T9SS type A sorting domain-containing protein [Paludibacteraceae bacterium]
MKITNTMKTVMMLLAGMVASPLMAITFTRVSVEQPEGITHYRMYDEGKIYFSGNSMVIDTVGNGKVESIALSQVDKMLFETVDLSASGVERVISMSPKLSLFPNPTSDVVTVEMDRDGSYPYRIYSMDGECLMKGVTSNGAVIDLSLLAKGVYMIELNGTYLKICKL